MSLTRTTINVSLSSVLIILAIFRRFFDYGLFFSGRVDATIRRFGFIPNHATARVPADTTHAGQNVMTNVIYGIFRYFLNATISKPNVKPTSMRDLVVSPQRRYRLRPSPHPTPRKPISPTKRASRPRPHSYNGHIAGLKPLQLPLKVSQSPNLDTTPETPGIDHGTSKASIPARSAHLQPKRRHSEVVSIDPPHSDTSLESLTHNRRASLHTFASQERASFISRIQELEAGREEQEKQRVAMEKVIAELMEERNMLRMQAIDERGEECHQTVEDFPTTDKETHMKSLYPSPPISPLIGLGLSPVVGLGLGLVSSPEWTARRIAFSASSPMLRSSPSMEPAAISASISSLGLTVR